jgi:Protein of unknown function (DUF3300)
MRGTPLVLFMLGLGSLAALQVSPVASAPLVSIQDQDPNQSQDPNQNQDPNSNPSQDQNQPPNVGQDQSANYQPFSNEELENLLSPIALYPDPLLAQVLVAATFPDQIDDAARYVRANGQNGIDDQNWDVSVKAVAHYPTVIQMMSDKIDWTTSLGQAYVNQSTDVTSAVQHLRQMARGAGNLDTTTQQQVITNGNYIAIVPVQPQYIYVPVYDPAICYYRRPYWGPAITFGAGFPIGAWLNLDFRWGFGGGYGGIFYTGWRPWGGWNDVWMARCRPYVHITNVYVNNRYTNISINRAVINRTVNVTNINRYNYVHKNVTYNNVQVNNTRINRVNNVRMVNNNVNRVNVNNRVLNRNIDTNNSRINEFRGRDNNVGNNRPPQNQNQPRPNFQNNNRPPANFNQSNVHTFGRSEGNFNANHSSARGQTSRAEMNRPVRNEAPRGGGENRGGGGGNRGGGGRPH